MGRRVNGTLMAGYLYDGQLRIAAQLDGAGAVVSRFYYTESPNSPSFMLRDGQTYRIFSDHLGSPRLVINVATGAVVLRRSYDPFGRILLDSNPGWLPHGFAGGLYDPDTGLVRFGARDYDPNTGRWTTKDPIRFDGGVNLYAYAENDPCNKLDVTGLATIINNSSSTIWILYTTADGGMQAWPLEPRESSDLYTGDADGVIWSDHIDKISDSLTGKGLYIITDSQVEKASATVAPEILLEIWGRVVLERQLKKTLYNAAAISEFGKITNICGETTGDFTDITKTTCTNGEKCGRREPKEPGTTPWTSPSWSSP